MPVRVRSHIRRPHRVRTAPQAKVEQLKDEELIIFARSRGEILVTTNHDCARTARRPREARMVYLRVVEASAEEAMGKAMDWIARNRFPDGRVLRVTKTGEPGLMTPIPWRQDPPGT